MHAAEALAGQRVAVGEQHVGVRVAVAVARLAPAAHHHGVAIVTRGTPGSQSQVLALTPVNEMFEISAKILKSLAE